MTCTVYAGPPQSVTSLVVWRHIPPRGAHRARHWLLALALVAGAALTSAARGVELSIDEFTDPTPPVTYYSIVFKFSAISGLTAGTNFGFQDFRITIVAGATVTPTTADSTWYSSDQVASINQIITNSTSPQYYYFPLATLTNNVTQPLSPTLLSAVQAINIHACTNDTGLDYTLDYIRATTVPEPSTALLALGVTLGLALCRRPRRRAALKVASCGARPRARPACLRPLSGRRGRRLIRGAGAGGTTGHPADPTDQTDRSDQASDTTPGADGAWGHAQGCACHRDKTHPGAPGWVL